MMMTRDDICAGLAAAGLGSVLPDVEQLLLPSIRLITARADETGLPTGSTKMGGQPDLPPGLAWPVGKGAPLAFIAQIRLEDVRGFAAAEALPHSGLLAFFYDATQQTFGDDPNDRGGWQVLHVLDPVATLRRRDPPDQVPASAQFRACALTYAEEWTLPSDPRAVLPRLSWSPNMRGRYDQVLTTFPTPAAHRGVRHRLLGHPDTLQDDMHLECQLASHGVASPDDVRAAQLTAGAADWRLLLQVDTDDQTAMRWASTGTLYYWITAAALQAGRLSDVWVIVQSE
jgi:uncharacterized protein YwqG